MSGGLVVDALDFSKQAQILLGQYRAEIYARQLARAIRVRDRARQLAPKAEAHDDREPRLAPAIVVIEGEDGIGKYIEVGVSSEYVPHGFRMEFGNSHASARPYMRPALAEHEVI